MGLSARQYLYGSTSKLLFGFLAILIAKAAHASDFYASPTGSSSGNGSINNPWDLQTAFNQPSSVKPGDTIWMRGGTYHGAFNVNLTGTASSPIIVRNYNNERATIDGGAANATTQIVTVNTSHVWLWGFEVMSSATQRQLAADDGSWPTSDQIPYGEAFATISNGAVTDDIRFINLYIHDTRQGISKWVTSTNSIIYGNIIFDNGWEAGGAGRGHGVYSQNQNTPALVSDNFLWGNFGLGMQAYGTHDTTAVDFEDMEYNTVFSNQVGGLLIGEASINIQNPIMNGNMLYDPAEKSTLDMGNDPWGQGCTNGTMTNNYVLGNTLIDPSCNLTTMTGNTIMWAKNGFTESQFPNNTYYGIGDTPSTNKIVIRQNVYESNRYHIIIFNWQNLTSVPVDLTGKLSAGDTYELHSVQNYYSDVVTGTYVGGTLSVSMTNHIMAQPIGYGQTVGAATFPQFGAFVLIKNPGSVQAPPPSNSICDANGDGKTDVSDVQMVVNEALKVTNCTTDVNKDGNCDIIDVQRVINAALGSACVSP